MPSYARVQDSRIPDSEHPRKETKIKIFDFSGRSEILDCAEYHQHFKS